MDFLQGHKRKYQQEEHEGGWGRRQKLAKLLNVWSWCCVGEIEYLEDFCEEGGGEVVIEPLLKKLHFFSDTWHGFSRKQAIFKYPSSSHYESDTGQLSWTVRMNVIDIFQCSYLDFYRKKCLSQEGQGGLRRYRTCAVINGSMLRILTGLVYALLSLSWTLFFLQKAGIFTLPWTQLVLGRWDLYGVGTKFQVIQVKPQLKESQNHEGNTGECQVDFVCLLRSFLRLFHPTHGLYNLNFVCFKTVVYW